MVNLCVHPQDVCEVGRLGQEWDQRLGGGFDCRMQQCCRMSVAIERSAALVSGGCERCCMAAWCEAELSRCAACLRADEVEGIGLPGWLLTVQQQDCPLRDCEA